MSVLGLVLVVLGTTLRFTVQANLSAGLDRELAQKVRHLAAVWLRSGGTMYFLSPSGPLSSSMPSSGEDRRRQSQADPPVFQPRFLDLRGRNLGRRPQEGPWDPDAFALAARGQEKYSTINWVHVSRGPGTGPALRAPAPPSAGGLVRVLSVPLWKSGQVVGVLQAAQSLTEVRQEVDRLTDRLLMMMPLALLIAGMAGAFLTDRALRPVRKITEAAERIEASALSDRLPVTGNDEFSELAVTFNAMLGRLEAAFEQQQRFTADASHELRTPLTIIKANASRALSGPRSAEEYRRAIDAVNRAADKTNKIVQDLLLLARADAGQLGIETRPTLIREVLEEASESIRCAEDTRVNLVAVDPLLEVLGSHHHLSRLFENLLDNAARHSAPDGTIAVAAYGQGESVIVQVEDTGEGIPAEHLPHLCERFYRVDPARARSQGGTGLGLTICQSIVEAHQGSLSIESMVGEGTTVTVRLPRAPGGIHEERTAPPAYTLSDR